MKKRMLVATADKSNAEKSGQTFGQPDKVTFDNMNRRVDDDKSG